MIIWLGEAAIRDLKRSKLATRHFPGNPDRISTSSITGPGAPRFSVSSDISIIDASHVNETMWNSTMMSSASSGAALPAGVRRPHIFDSVNVAELTRAKKTLFLDGCKIFVHGMQAGHAEKGAKLINSGKKPVYVFFAVCVCVRACKLSVVPSPVIDCRADHPLPLPRRWRNAFLGAE